jgi:hypothetical protein
MYELYMSFMKSCIEIQAHVIWILIWFVRCDTNKKSNI